MPDPLSRGLVLLVPLFSGDHVAFTGSVVANFSPYQPQKAQKSQNGCVLFKAQQNYLGLVYSHGFRGCPESETFDLILSILSIHVYSCIYAFVFW